MTGINAQNSNDGAQEKMKSSKNGDVNGLLESAVVSELKKKSGVMDPMIYDDIKYPEIYSTIRDKMKYLRDTGDKDFS